MLLFIFLILYFIFKIINKVERLLRLPRFIYGSYCGARTNWKWKWLVNSSFSFRFEILVNFFWKKQNCISIDYFLLLFVIFNYLKAGGLLLLCSIGVGIAFFIKSKKNNDDEDDTNVIATTHYGDIPHSNNSNFNSARNRYALLIIKFNNFNFIFFWKKNNKPTITATCQIKLIIKVCPINFQRAKNLLINLWMSTRLHQTPPTINLWRETRIHHKRTSLINRYNWIKTINNMLAQIINRCL